MNPLIEPALADQAFVSDVAGAPRRRDLFHLWWLGQSGYLIQWGHTRVLIDPYLSDSLTRKYAGTAKPHVRMSRRVVDPSQLGAIDLVTSSHGHTDHLDAETLQAIRSRDQPTLIAPLGIRDLVSQRWGEVSVKFVDAGDSRRIGDVRVAAVPAAHDRWELSESGHHIYLGYLLHLGAFTIYHSGDSVPYVDMDLHVCNAAGGPTNIDVAILPINGKVGNMGGRDAARLAKDIGARLVIPCHYDMFEFNTADPNDEFVPECERIGQPYRVLRLGERFSSSDLPPRA